jgi:hypothetical protein
MFVYYYCYVYVFLVLWMFLSVYSVHCVVLCTVCVQMCAVLLPPSIGPIAVNKIYQYLRKSRVIQSRYRSIFGRTVSSCGQLWESLKRPIKVKVKVRSYGVLRHRDLCSLLYPNSWNLLPSFTTRGAVYQPDTQRTLLAKEETSRIWSTISEFTKRVEFFFMPQSWEGMLWIFPTGKIRRLRSGANPRSWVPEASMLTPRPPKPL